MRRAKERLSQRLQVFRCGRLTGWLVVPLTELRVLEKGNKCGEQGNI